MNGIRNVVVWVLSAIYTSCWWSLFGLIILVIIWLMYLNMMKIQ